ncbi:MAG TPA: aminotransferase class I/II-fold pyridoxal phosphate-dependent enzyme [Spirochaetota bacterium]|nr:aminotransferase class I/II-fold pyridoxal phosphate-dependent enzyme [Spirochaetota bacterium]
MKLSLVKKNNPEHLLSQSVQSISPSGIREFFDIVYSTPDCISLGVGEPDFITPWRISDSGIFAIKDGCTHYTPNRGLPRLCSLVAKSLQEKNGVEYNPETDILITMGVSQGLDVALRSIIDPGDEVIITEPCYVSYTANVTLQMGKPVILTTYAKDNFKIDIEKLKALISPKTKAIILNYPSNPSGGTIERDVLEKIAALAIDNNFFIISDEIYSSIFYEGEHFSITSIPEVRDRTIYLNGFSKSFAMTGWRLGYIAGPKFLLDQVLKIHQYTALCAPSLSQYAAIEALEKGDGDVEKMILEYKKRRNYIVSRFNDIGYPCRMPEGAFYVFPDISPSGMNSRDFALALLKVQKVAVVPGVVFGACGEHHIRCSYATSMENIREAMDRIEKFHQSLGKQ